MPGKLREESDVAPKKKNKMKSDKNKTTSPEIAKKKSDAVENERLDEDSSPNPKKLKLKTNLNGQAEKQNGILDEINPSKSKTAKKKANGLAKEQNGILDEGNPQKSKTSKKKANGQAKEQNGILDELSPPKPKKAKKEEKLNEMVGEADELRISSKPTKGKKSKLPNGSINEAREKPKNDSSLVNGFSSPASTDSEPEQALTPEQKDGAFSNFPISKGTVQLLKDRGVTYLFPIQVKTFHHVYEGRDVVAQARTGTGKTFSFAIPLTEKLQRTREEQKRGYPPKVLVLAPTRELANQVAKDFKDITKTLTVACFYGGTPYNGQIDLIRKGIDILVGTPGRIKDLLESGRLDLTKLRHVVLDEVDQMLDMGFAEDVESIISGAYNRESEDNPQTLLFSATCPQWVYKVAKKYMKAKYEQVDLIGRLTQKTATTVEHLAIQCRGNHRAAVIGDVIQVYSGNQGRAIVFCETKKDASEMALNSNIKQEAQALHGDIAQAQREITLKGFRNGVFKVLVATNVAARGLDIPEVDLVIQSSPPQDVESYIHRSGRTGRAGRTGICICFFQPKERGQLRYVEQKSGITFKHVDIPSVVDVIQASSKDAISSLASVPEEALEKFRSYAKTLIEEKGAVEALAAALAHIAGASSFQQRSLISSDKGFVTMALECSEELKHPNAAQTELRAKLPADLAAQVTRMCLLKGKKGVCFDVPSAQAEQIKAEWKDSAKWKLSLPQKLPELERDYNDGGRASNFRQRGQHGNRPGFSRGHRPGNQAGSRQRGGFNRGGNRNGFQNRGQKRNFQQAFD
ncbi:ATP-dependent RNA helicase DDX50-like [Tachyglossus aculeatus]|uniref:ATP-dependent RNA helicase DDX50-like n=1 Tax=Tachyglossus aculeatus TaxID=9261 RepID=UPI0018F66EE5|nr:ATP-dependent RNA helicase DDX50-like [Tachyglossus aculeatus]